MPVLAARALGAPCRGNLNIPEPAGKRNLSRKPLDAYQHRHARQTEHSIAGIGPELAKRLPI